MEIYTLSSNSAAIVRNWRYHRERKTLFYSLSSRTASQLHQPALCGIALPPEWEPPRGESHIYSTQVVPIIRHRCGARFLLSGFARDIQYGVRMYHARREAVASLLSFESAWPKRATA